MSKEGETIPLQTEGQGTSAATQNARASLLFAAFGRAKEYAGQTFSQRKPWTELLDRNSISRPENVSEATARLRKNLAYFRINYMIIVILTLALCIAFNPQSLLVLCVVSAAWGYVFIVRTSPLSIGGRTISEREKLLGMTAISFVTLFFLTSVGAVLFSALCLGATVIALHGAVRVPDDLFTDEVVEGGSIWSAITGGGGATIPPALATNV
ncbi:hypothetical protein BSKO_11473 [Bryopsis sp. KO-2023]|nr:hypothetical protein BSKO_11473 [Bryopsis sp. KO-2023]